MQTHEPLVFEPETHEPLVFKPETHETHEGNKSVNRLYLISLRLIGRLIKQIVTTDGRPTLSQTNLVDPGSNQGPSANEVQRSNIPPDGNLYVLS